MYLGSRFESTELRWFDVRLMKQNSVLNQLFNIQELKTAFITAKLAFLLQTHTHTRTALTTTSMQMTHCFASTANPLTVVATYLVADEVLLVAAVAAQHSQAVLAHEVPGVGVTLLKVEPHI